MRDELSQDKRSLSRRKSRRKKTIKLFAFPLDIYKNRDNSKNNIDKTEKFVYNS